MAAKDDSDPILANERRLKNQKKIVQQLHQELKTYSEAYRHFLNAERAFYETLDNLCESSWELKAEFSKSLQALGSIAEKGAKSLETTPVEETIMFRDRFGPFEKEIQDYKEKQKISEAAEKKHGAYLKKKSRDADELRKLELTAYEKKTSLGITRRKLNDELPVFYKSRTDYYSSFWCSVFQIRSKIARAENETFDYLIDLVQSFDKARLQQVVNPPAVQDLHFKSAALGSDAKVPYELITTELQGESPDATIHQNNGLQQQQRLANFGMPTSDADDGMGEESNRAKPVVPRRSSFRLRPK